MGMRFPATARVLEDRIGPKAQSGGARINSFNLIGFLAKKGGHMRKILATLTIVICLTTMIIAGLPLTGDAAVIYGCLSKKGELRIVSDPELCVKHESPISWTSVSGINTVIRGTVNDDGSIAAGTGFTVSSPNEIGERTIQFNTPFPTKPTCVLTPSYTTCTSGICVGILGIIFCDSISSNGSLSYVCYGYDPNKGPYCCDLQPAPVSFICTQ
jgi:hypothetical protein